MQCPLFGPQVTLTIEWQVDAFSNADSGDASQQESIGIEVVCSAQFLLKPFIVFRRQRPGEILRTNGKILANNETRMNGMALEERDRRAGREGRADTLRGCGCSAADPDLHSQRNQPSIWGSRRICDNRRTVRKFVTKILQEAVERRSDSF